MDCCFYFTCRDAQNLLTNSMCADRKMKHSIYIVTASRIFTICGDCLLRYCWLLLSCWFKQIVKMENIKQIIVGQTINGMVFKCFKCNLIHVEFKNLNFNFTAEQYQHFADYIKSLDGAQWEHANRNSSYIRKIMIPIGYQNINMMFNSDELSEFKALLSMSQADCAFKQCIRTSQFDFFIFLN